MTGLQYLHVPYKGGGAAMTDVIGAQTDITVQPIAESLPFIRDKRLQAMGQTGRTRSPIAPDIPTIEEEGRRATRRRLVCRAPASAAGSGRHAGEDVLRSPAPAGPA